MPDIEYAMSVRPLIGQTACGDLPWVKVFNNKILLCLIDVAGHGILAEKLAKQCLDVLEQHHSEALQQIINQLYQCAFQAKRALVVGLTLIELDTGLINYLSVGNINTRILGKTNYRFVARTGILNGVNFPHLFLATHSFNDGDLLMMYSDGVSNHFDINQYSEIFTDKIEHVAAEIISRFGKANDDASCIVLRYWK